jgi:hypothetical protein
MQMDKRPYGIVLILFYLINITLFGLIGVYFLDFGLRYFNLISNLSTLLIDYYIAMLPLDLIVFLFDVFIIYFLFSARKVIADRVLGGAGMVISALLSAVFVYFLKFIFLNVFIYFQLIPVVGKYHFFLLYKALLFRMMVFLVGFLVLSMFMEYSKSVKWHFGYNYKGLYKLKESFYFSFAAFYLSLLKVSVVLLPFIVTVLLPFGWQIKIFLSIFFSAIVTYFLFFRKR